MERVRIHYEDKTIDCKEEHGPFFFLQNVSIKYPNSCKKNDRICIRAICIECGKVADYTMNKEYCRKNVVFHNGEFLVGPSTSKVKTFYDTNNRYCELMKEYNSVEEAVKILNKEI